MPVQNVVNFFDATSTLKRNVKMGLGEAILRLVHVELKYANGLFEIPDHLRMERDLIVQALNQYELDLGFDCNADLDGNGIPDSVEIFRTSAETSCCRIVPKDTSRKEAEPAPTKRTRGDSSRRGKA